MEAYGEMIKIFLTSVSVEDGFEWKVTQTHSEENLNLSCSFTAQDT